MSINENVYSIDNPGGVLKGCIDLVESPDDGGWYAHEYDFSRADNATRTSSKIYRDRAALVGALQSGKHRWQKWD